MGSDLLFVSFYKFQDPPAPWYLLQLIKYIEKSLWEYCSYMLGWYQDIRLGFNYRSLDLQNINGLDMDLELGQ